MKILDFSIIGLVFSPLFGFIVSGLLRNKIKSSFLGFFSSFAVIISFIFTCILIFLYNPFEQKLEYVLQLGTWIDISTFRVPFAYQIDQLTIFMCLIITGIGSLIHIYSISYMKGEDGFGRYFSYLNLFIFCMLNLVLSNNLLLMFFGWEGVGLCSYLLIGFYFDKNFAALAGMKAFIVNRIGDLGVLVGITIIFWHFGSLEYTKIFQKLTLFENLPVLANILGICFVIGAVGKSAQIPLYVWLPDAMAGPTPVSALIHAATMVTAGIFLIVRLNPIFVHAQEVNYLIAVIGITTALFSSIIGLVQNDIKKILAYSTVSQLGYMFFAVGIGAYVAALFHLMTHAFFKALLFLGSGSVIHALQGEQDIRKMGFLKSKMKITFLSFLIGGLALSGIPIFSGFFSKDLILEKAFLYNPFFWGLGILTALFTSFYIFRLIFLTFFGEFRGLDELKSHIHESPVLMTIPLIILIIGSVFSGFIEVPILFFGGVNFLTKYFSPIFATYTTHSSTHFISHQLEIGLMICSVGIGFLGIFFAFLKYVTFKKIPTEKVNFITKLVLNKFYIDEFYQFIIVRPLLFVSDKILYLIDQKFIDRSFVGVGIGFVKFSKITRFIQTGRVGDYALYILLGSMLALVVYLYQI